ncbi:MAG: peptidylprolyl isomerase [Bacteroidales bacterium]|nr:peptidylprolyl isomerase [Bacteroidales bacterium]
MMAEVKIQTTLGDITVRLYDETPLHRDNFLKLAKEGYYDGTIFHRVIKGFMVQGGDPDTKNAKKGANYGAGGPDYTIEAEIKPGLFHKRGALAAARLGDEFNPERRSSGSQFYIVWGEGYNDSKLNQFVKQMAMVAEQNILDRLAQEHREEIMEFRRNRDRAGLSALQDKLIAQAKEEAKKQNVGMSAEAKEAYKSVGGTPFLDNEYTVFGEVIEGLDIVEKIQNAKTLPGDRPVEDIVMTKVTVC